MPIISMFYGIIIRMLYKDNRKHHNPHIHVEYQADVVVMDIETGNILEGSFPPAKLKLVLAWMEIHKDELLANWKLAVEGQTIFKIDGLK